MNPNDLTPSNPSPVSEPPVQQMEEYKKPSFWISQLFILLATVMGVYLASSQGFKQALAYGDIQADKTNYYLRKSLQAELADNLPLVRNYMKSLETGGLPARKAPFKVDTFVWENMKFSSATLETPSELLRESRLFYREVASIQEKIADNTYSAPFGIKKLQELVDHMEQHVLPKFSENLKEVQESLRKRGVEIE